ncbi:MAG: small ribosomal subunit Rsm22 family protein [Pseudomonadota bacterium]
MSEGQLLQSIEELNQLFTGQKEYYDYTRSPKLVSAYTFFYMPTNIPKLNFLLQQLPAALHQDMASCELVDYGTGPGTYLASFLNFFPDHHPTCYGIDQSPLMLEQASKALGYLRPDKKNIFWRSSLPPKGPQPRILIFGHSMVEMGCDKAHQLIKQIDPRYLLFLEPGTMTSYHQLMPLRGELVKSGYLMMYPCFKGDCPCPMAEKKSPDWCHQVMHFNHGGQLERISQKLNLDRRSMPLIAHAYCRGLKAINYLLENTGRLIRVWGEDKASFKWELCLPSENGLKLVKVEILRRHLSSEMWKELRAVNTGTCVHFQIEKKINDNYWRIKLS